MTNQTNIDYLFKLTAPAPERGAGLSTSSSARRPAFDDHLMNASAPTSGSSSTTAARTRPADNAPPESDRLTNRARHDDGYTSTETDRDPVENSTPVAAAATGDPKDDADRQSASGAEETSADQVASSEDVGEKDAAEELAAAALLAEHAVRTSQNDAALAEAQSAEAAVGDAELAAITPKSSSQFRGDAEQTAGNLLAGERSDLKRARDDAASNVEIDLGAPAQSSESSARQLDGANASNSTRAAANDDKRQRESSRKSNGVHATAVDASTPATNAAASAEPKPAKSTTAGRRAANQNNESAQERRDSASTTTNCADANASQNASAAPVVANVASATTATAAAAREASEEASRAVKPIGHSADGIHLTARAQRSGVAGSRRAHGTQAPDLPRVEAARFVGRVAKAVQTAQDRGGLVQLRLSPPELGSLRLELSMQNGVMTAAVETETPAARQVLLDHLPALRERLAEQSIRIERFDVDVRQENSGGQTDPRASQQDHRQQRPQQPNPHHAGRAAPTQHATSDAPHVPLRLTNTELNLLA